MAKWYSLKVATDIIYKELGIKHQATAKKFIHQKKEPRLKAIIDNGGEGKATRYRIKDEWLDEFISQYEQI